MGHVRPFCHFFVLVTRSRAALLLSKGRAKGPKGQRVQTLSSCGNQKHRTGVLGEERRDWFIMEVAGFNWCCHVMKKDTFHQMNP